jgi:hypothetical protein
VRCQQRKCLLESLVLLGVLDLVFSFGSILHDPMKRHFSETILMRCMEAKSRIGALS